MWICRKKDKHNCLQQRKRNVFKQVGAEFGKNNKKCFQNKHFKSGRKPVISEKDEKN